MTLDSSNNNKRIAKNTLLLYFRMFFIMAVNLYTSRVVLKVLGVEDFGIYNVVGGIIVMFAFLNSAMATATQRFLTFELGTRKRNMLSIVFNISIIIHGMIAIIIILAGETIGLWFFYNKMNIPESRMFAALCVYQLSIVSTIVMIMSIPYNATIIAHEKMGAFAYISVLEVLMKLTVAYTLWFVNADKLIVYALLMLLTQLIIRFVYGLYCKKHFEESAFRWLFDREVFKSMLSFAAWNLWGNLASVCSSQGTNILLNMYFGPVVNAARGISSQINAAVVQFAYSFQTALNPQITKNYAAGNIVEMNKLVFRASKFAFFLLLFLSLPILINTTFLIRLWLGEYPNFTIAFARFAICMSIIDAVANPLMTCASATGNIRKYQFIIGAILLCTIPLAYAILKSGGNPLSVYFVQLVIYICAFIARLFIVRTLIDFSITRYIRNVLSRIIIVGLFALSVPLVANFYVEDDVERFFITSILSVLSSAISIYYLGMSHEEKAFVKEKINNIRRKNHDIH